MYGPSQKEIYAAMLAAALIGIAGGWLLMWAAEFFYHHIHIFLK